MTVCPQCGYNRTKQDDNFVSKEECPKCGIFYNKWKPIEITNNAEPSITIATGQTENKENKPKENKTKLRKIIFISVCCLSLYCLVMLFGLPLFGMLFSSASGTSSFKMPDWSMNFYLTSFYLLPLAALLGLVLGIIGISIKRNSQKKAMIIMGFCLGLYLVFMFLSKVAMQSVYRTQNSDVQLFSLAEKIYAGLGMPIWLLYLFLFPFSLLPFAALSGIIYGISEIGRKKNIQSPQTSDSVVLAHEGINTKKGISWSIILACFIPVILIIMFLNILFSWRP